MAFDEILIYALAWHNAYQQLLQADTHQARIDAAEQAKEKASFVLEAYQRAHVYDQPKCQGFE